MNEWTIAHVTEPFFHKHMSTYEGSANKSWLNQSQTQFASQNPERNSQCAIQADPEDALDCSRKRASKTSTDTNESEVGGREPSSRAEVKLLGPPQAPLSPCASEHHPTIPHWHFLTHVSALTRGFRGFGPSSRGIRKTMLAGVVFSGGGSRKPC